MDSTEDIRRAMIESGQPARDLAEGEANCQTCGGSGIILTKCCWRCLGSGHAASTERWDTAALCRDFEVIGFAAPFVVVKRKADGVKGSLEFTHSPRVYFNWKAD